MYMTLYRKYRPKSFEEVYGEQDIIKTIKNSLKSNKMAHAYLFTGPRGVGKTTTARLIAKGLNCITNGITDNPCNVCENCIAVDNGNFFDLIEIDAASNRGIDEIRELKDKINYKPLKGRKKVYIIDEVHMLTKEAFNALLKTLEEPPEHALFILATTEPDKVLDTIISRCQRYDFGTLTYEEIKNRLTEIALEEKIKVSDDSLMLIYEKSGGSARDAISIFEKVASYYLNESIDAEMTEKALGLVPSKKLLEFIALMASRNRDAGLKMIDDLYSEGIKSDDFFKKLSVKLKDLLISGHIDEYGLDEESAISSIEKIYDTLAKFRFEEDKRLLGYVILYKLTEQEKKHVKTVIREKVAEPEVVYNPIIEEQKTEEIAAPINLTITEIKAKWKEIVAKTKEKRISFMAFLSLVKPAEFKNGILYLEIDSEYRFHKMSIEKKENNKIIVDIIKDIFGCEIGLKVNVVGEQKTVVDGSELTKKVIDFFEGEIVETR